MAKDWVCTYCFERFSEDKLERDLLSKNRVLLCPGCERPCTPIEGGSYTKVKRKKVPTVIVLQRKPKIDENDRYTAPPTNIIPFCKAKGYSLSKKDCDTCAHQTLNPHKYGWRHRWINCQEKNIGKWVFSVW